MNKSSSFFIFFYIKDTHQHTLKHKDAHIHTRDNHKDVAESE